MTAAAEPGVFPFQLRTGVSHLVPLLVPRIASGQAQWRVLLRREIGRGRSYKSVAYDRLRYSVM